MKITTSKRFINGLILTSFSLILFSSFKVDELNKNLSTGGNKIKLIVIDAGHGGQDGSTHGAISKEKDVALAVALKLGKSIEDRMPGVKVIYTRTTDVFVKLYDRIGLANKEKADLFISIHCNSMPLVYYKGKRIPDPRPRGTLTLVSGFSRLDEQDVALRENTSILLEKDYKANYGGYDPKDPESFIIFSLMKNAFRDQSIKLASLVQDEFQDSGRVNEGVREKSLAVLAAAGMPAILTEIGYVSNPEEERYINSDNGQEEIVNSIVSALIKYKKDIES